MAKPGLPAPPGSAGLFHTVGKGKCLLSPAHPPKHALSARMSPPQPQPHLPIRTGQWAPESPRPGREDPGAVPRGWSPGPSLRPPGAVGALQAGPPPTVRRLELSKPHPKALPSLQYPQSKAQASPYPSSSPINGASSKRPSRTTQGQVASAWPCPVYSVFVSSSDWGFRSPACLVPCLISNTTWVTPESMPERCPSSGRK